MIKKILPQRSIFYFTHSFNGYPLAFFIAIWQYIDMFCVNCFNKNTTVTNSRPNKKQPQIWRRRQCNRCGYTFTTHERPSLADNKKISLATGMTDIFNLGKLIISISRSFTHNPHEAAYSSLWLAQTVENLLSTEHEIIRPEDIAAITHQTLRQYDEAAAMQYALQHNLLKSIKRRGRPSLA